MWSAAASEEEEYDGKQNDKHDGTRPQEPSSTTAVPSNNHTTIGEHQDQRQ